MRTKVPGARAALAAAEHRHAALQTELEEAKEAVERQSRELEGLRSHSSSTVRWKLLAGIGTLVLTLIATGGALGGAMLGLQSAKDTTAAQLQEERARQSRELEEGRARESRDRRTNAYAGYLAALRAVTEQAQRHSDVGPGAFPDGVIVIPLKTAEATKMQDLFRRFQAAGTLVEIYGSDDAYRAHLEVNKHLPSMESTMTSGDGKPLKVDLVIRSKESGPRSDAVGKFMAAACRDASPQPREGCKAR